YNVVSSDPGNSLAAAALAEYNVVLSSSPSVRIPPPHVLERMRDGERALSELTERFRELSAGGPSDDAVHAATGVAFLVSRQQSAASTSRMRQQYASEMALHEGVVREGEHFLDANPQAVSLWDYQSIVVSYMVTCRRHDHLVCAGPQPHAISFYGRTDVTLGQYLEEMCFDLNYDCPGSSRTCTHPMYEHRRSYIHHNGRID
ncbi:Mitochondrial distribution and morphology protein 12, partial [Linderina pennispora]